MKVLNALKTGTNLYRIDLELDAEKDDPKILKQLNFPFFDLGENKDLQHKASRFPTYKEFIEGVNKPTE